MKVHRNARHISYSCLQCALTNQCLCSDLGAGDIADFNKYITYRGLLDCGESLFMAGGVFNALYIVHSGCLKSYILSNSGDQQITGFHFSGDLLGVEGIENGRHIHSMEAQETCTVCVITLPDYEDMCRQWPAVQRQMLAKLSHNAKREHQLSFALGKLNAEQKMAAFLLDMSVRMKLRGESASAFNLCMSRYDLANYLGLAVETVSRLFRRFQTKSLLKVDHRSVQILNFDGLIELSQGEYPGINKAALQSLQKSESRSVALQRLN